MTLDAILPGMSRQCKVAFEDVIVTKQLKHAFGIMTSSVKETLVSRLAGSFTIDEREIITGSINTMLKNIGPVLEKKFIDAGMILDDCIKRDVSERKGSTPVMVSRARSSRHRW